MFFISTCFFISTGFHIHRLFISTDFLSTGEPPGGEGCVCRNCDAKRGAFCTRPGSEVLALFLSRCARYRGKTPLVGAGVLCLQTLRWRGCRSNVINSGVRCHHDVTCYITSDIRGRLTSCSIERSVSVSFQYFLKPDDRDHTELQEQSRARSQTLVERDCCMYHQLGLHLSQ